MVDPPSPLRIGTGVHYGLDLMAKSSLLAGDKAKDPTYKMLTINEIIGAVREGWFSCEPKTERGKKMYFYDIEMVEALLRGYWNRWSGAPVKPIHSELAFKVPLVNPGTGRGSRTFELEGVIDKVINIPDYGICIGEHKTTVDEIGPGADYWKGLAIDLQVTAYLTAAQAMGIDVKSCLYDVLRKPGIRPKEVNHLHPEDKLPQVMTPSGERLIKKNGEPYKTKPKDRPDSFILRRPETPKEFGARLKAILTENPKEYFRREQVQRIGNDLEDGQQDLWDWGQALRESIKNNRWPRNDKHCKSPGMTCQFRALCTAGFNPMRDGLEDLPEEFHVIETAHPELTEKEEV